MEHRCDEMNRVLIEVINDITRAEEDSMASEFEDLSFRELHVIEAVCSSMEEGTPHTSADIAGELNITAGTLTTAVSLLEKKGYLIRRRDANDKRIVRIAATEKGVQANIGHMAFHREMISGMLALMSESEAEALIGTLKRIDGFFKDTYTGKTPGGNIERLEIEE